MQFWLEKERNKLIMTLCLVTIVLKVVRLFGSMLCIILNYFISGTENFAAFVVN